MTSGDRLSYLLLAIYVASAITFAIERNFPKCLYFIGAAVLIVGVMMMD